MKWFSCIICSVSGLVVHLCLLYSGCAVVMHRLTHPSWAAVSPLHSCCRRASFVLKRLVHNKREFSDEILGGSIEQDDSPIIFDRNTKRAQRNRAALRPRSREYDHLKDSIAARLADRLNLTLQDILGRSFPSVLDLGSGSGHLLKHIANRNGVQSIIMCDSSEEMLMRDIELDSNYKVKPIRMVIDEEYLPFAPAQFDLIISNLSMQWVNDLPGFFKQIKKCLKPDGVFLGSTFGENTLHELRNTLYLAEQEREGGFGPHTSPFTRVSDVGNLISASRMALPTIDTEDVKMVYSDIFTLFDDLQGMGESNAVVHRREQLPRQTIAAAAAIYHHLYSSQELGGIPATFQIVYMIGWGPHPSQQKPLPRGSAKVHLSQIENMQGLSFGTGDAAVPTPKTDTISLDDLFKPNTQHSNAEVTQTTESKNTDETKDNEYVSEDFVISRIDSSGNMRRSTPKK